LCTTGDDDASETRPLDDDVAARVDSNRAAARAAVDEAPRSHPEASGLEGDAAIADRHRGVVGDDDVAPAEIENATVADVDILGYPALAGVLTAGVRGDDLGGQADGSRIANEGEARNRCR